MERAESAVAVGPAAATPSPEPYALFWLDLAGRVSRWSADCSALFGLSRQEAIGRDLADFLLPEERETDRPAAILRAAARDGDWQGVGWRLRADGRSFWAASSVTLVRTPNGLDIGFTVVTQDLTALVSDPVDALIAGEAAHLVSMGRVALDVSHDIRNILSAIRGFAGLLERDLPPDGRSHRAWHELLKACDRGTYLTARLGEVGRPEEQAGGSCDVASVLRGAEPLLRQVLPDHVTLRIASEGTLPRVPLGPSELELAVLNLVVNARDAIEAEGTVTVVARTESADAGPCVALSVRDDGCGMEPEVAERAFERRFTTKGAGLGTGLGLALVRETVVGAGGSVEVSSDPGRGTEVRVRLPGVRATEHPAAPHTPAGRRPKPRLVPRRRRAVVCCDSRVLGECVTDLMRREGFEVERRACSGGDRPHGAEGVDVALVEAAACACGATPPDPSVPTIWMTDARTSDEPLPRPLGQADAVLQWPFAPDELLVEVRALCRQARLKSSVH